MIKLKDLLNLQESVINEQKLPEVNFQDSFENNFITLTPGKWTKNADLVVSQIQDAIKQGNTLESLSVKVYGGASDLNATNRYRGNKEPNHNFGGDSEFPGWVTYKLPNGQDRPIGQYPNGYKIIKKGNPWLAKARSKSLEAALVPYISKKLGRKFDNIEIVADPVTSKSTKYARAVVSSAVKPTEEQFKYVIQYPWYTVDNQPNMVLVDGNIAAGWRQNKKSTMSTKWYQSTITDKNIRYSGFQKGGQAGGLINAYAFIKLNADAYRGSFALYRNEKSWLADVKKMTIYAPGLQVGELTVGPPNSKKYLPGYRGADGYLDKTGSSKYAGLAKFNMRSKDYIVSSGIPYYLFKPQGDKAFYMADLFKAKSELNAPATGAYDSDGNRSLIVGKQYSVVDSKGVKNPNALVYTGKTTIKTFKS